MTETTQVEKKSGRPRSEDADKAIIEATLDLLAEVGVGGMSIESIASRAGVGKTTIYRRWSDKESLICDAMVALKGPPPQPSGATLRDDLIELGDAAARGRESARRRKLYACFVGEMSRHPTLMERYRQTVIKPRRDVIRGVLDRAAQRGELRADLDVEFMIDLVTAPQMHWALQNPDKDLTRELIEHFVDGVLDGLRPRE